MINYLNYWLGKLTYIAWDAKEGGRRLAEYCHLLKFEHWPVKRQEQEQSTKLTRLVQHAYQTSEWYKKIIDASGLDIQKSLTPADLQKLPVTTKLDIRENLNQFVSRAYKTDSLCKAKTGGSTGVSLNLYFDERCQQMRNGAQMYADNLAGWNIGDRAAAIWGNPPIAKTFKQKVRSFLLERTIYLDTMHLDDVSMSSFVAEWKKFNPRVIFGHSHSIYVFAKYLDKENISDLRPKGIIATSMMLLDHERALIEKVFGCKVSNRYGCEEVGLIAVECEQHQGMHINTSHIILECLDAQNNPVPAGTPGKLVITDLNNFGMPLIRYRVEDVGVLSDQPCSCGRNTPLLLRLEGRVADFLKKKDGGEVAGVSLVERTLTKIPGIEQMQLVQENLDSLIINRVKGVDFTDTTDAELIQELADVFGPKVALVINDVARIPQEKSGKYRFSICKI